MGNNKNKVLFVQKISDEEFETESLWCIMEGNNYIIDNIPFIARRVSLGDTIKVEYDADEAAFYFDGFIAVSGNSTIRIYFSDKKIIGDVRKQLEDLGCATEAFLERDLVAVNVPKDISYKPVKAFLENGEMEGKWKYEESCLCHEY